MLSMICSRNLTAPNLMKGFYPSPPQLTSYSTLTPLGPLATHCRGSHSSVGIRGTCTQDHFLLSQGRSVRTQAGQTGTGKKRGRAEQMVLVEESCFILRKRALGRRAGSLKTHHLGA